jgi:ABC-type antimicrobial peptide transport system permease subunit
LSTVTLRLKNPDEFAEVIAAFEADNRLQYFAPKREKKFFEEQSEMMATFIRILGIFITVIFSTGAMIGAMITMYGAVANRTVEIGTLRALGFYRRSILLAFLLESLFLSLGGGLVGLGIASLLQFSRSRRSTWARFRSWRFLSVCRRRSSRSRWASRC